MFTERENYLRTINNDNPDRLCNDYDAFAFCPDPIFWIDRTGVVPVPAGEIYEDSWGTKVCHPDGHPGPMPLVEGEHKLIKNIENWKNEIKVPDYEALAKTLDWTEVNEHIDAVDKTKQIPMTMMIVGLFERTHYLMGFEDSLVNHLLYPDEMHELLDVILEARIQQVKVILDNCKIEAIDHHDDFGSKEQLFLPPDVWREFYKERYRKLYDYIQGRGITLFHHGDSFMEPIASDLAEIGLKCWQGVLPSNNIPKLQKELAGKMTLMGGLDAGLIDRSEVDEAVIRKEVRRACEEYGPGGNFIPCLTYGGPGSIFDGVSAIIHDEIVKYNKDTYGIEDTSEFVLQTH